MKKSLRKTHLNFLMLCLVLGVSLPVMGETTYKLFDSNGNLNSTDFYTTKSKSSGQGSFEAVIQLGGNITSASSLTDAGRYVRYDVKTTSTKIIYELYNKATSSKKAYIFSKIEDASSTEKLIEESIAAGEGRVEKTLATESSDNRSVYFTVGDNSNLYIGQITVVESGDPLPRAGESGYSASFNKGRMNVNSSSPTLFEGLNIYATYKSFNGSYISISSNQTGFEWTTKKPVVLAISSYNKKAYSIIDQNKGTIFTASGSSSNDTIVLPTIGSYSLKAGGSSVQLSKISFLEYTPISSITLNPNAITLSVGESRIISANVLPTNATDKTLNWSSSDDKVAIVDASGKITAMGTGSATIYARSKSDSSISSSVEVTVKAGCAWLEIVRGKCNGGSGSADATGAIGGKVHYDVDSNRKLKDAGHFFVRLSEGNYFRAGDTLFFDIANSNDAIALNIYSFDKDDKATKLFQINNVKAAGIYYFVLPSNLPEDTYNALGAYRSVLQENITYNQMYVHRMSCDGCDGLEAPTLTAITKKITVDETCKIVHSPLPEGNFTGTYTIVGPDGNSAYIDATDSLFHTDMMGMYTITWTVSDLSNDLCALSSQITIKVLPTVCEIEPIIQPINAIPFTVFDKKHYIDLRVANVTSEVETAHYVLQSADKRDSITFSFENNELRMTGRMKLDITQVTMDTIHFVFTNTCTPAKTFKYALPIRILPETMKPRVAVVINGTKDNNDFTTYDTNEANECEDVKNALEETREGALNQYEVIFVNGRATKDSATIMDYYQQFDVVIITDYLNTQEGYTNALGVLVDKKPVLTFEAFVANLPNWHVSSSPKDPDERVTDMHLLCASHTIFRGSESDVIQILEPGTDNIGLNAFEINEAPNFLFLATINAIVGGQPKTLVTCCERQEVFTARMIIYGIQHSSMSQITEEGKRALVQMVDYLLSTDDSEMADCGLVFDNDSTAGHPHGGGDGKWSNPKNWGPNYNHVPTAYEPVRVIYQCIVDVDTARAASVKINQGKDSQGRTLNGSLVIKPNGGLTVASFINKVKDTRYANLYETTPADIRIEADATGNGALVFGNDEDDVYATVLYYSKGTDAKTNDPVWQYMGTPLQEDFRAIDLYYGAWMCRWQEASDLGGLWQWVENDDPIVPFAGYCISQTAERTYTLQGRLNRPTDRNISLMPRDEEGYAFAANSWVAPVKIQEFQDNDFVDAEKAIYIYHTGSYAQAEEEGDISSKIAAATLPGQYAVVPIHSSPYIAGADSVIPSMQGFFIKTTANFASLSLPYNRVVYDSKYYKTSTVPMRTPSRSETNKLIPHVMRIDVYSNRWADQVHILSNDAFTEQYLDGWDGAKVEGDAKAPMLSLLKEAGEMAVACVSDADNHYLQFRAGEDTQYTLHFNYQGEPLWLVDQLTGDVVAIHDGTTYSFLANNRDATKRFLLTRHPAMVETSIDMVQKDDGWIVENYQHQPVEVSIWDIEGRLWQQWNTTDNLIDISNQLPTGVYTLRIVCGDKIFVNKLIGKEGQL